MLEDEVARGIEGTGNDQFAIRGRFGEIIFSCAHDVSPLLVFLQVIIQTIEAFLPVASIMFQPVHRVLHWLCLEAAGTPLRGAAANDEPAALQHLEVFGDRGKTHIKWLCELLDRGFTGGKPGKDCPPGRIGKSCKRRTKLVDCHIKCN